MNGVVLTDGLRYSISKLHWAGLADVGNAVLPPGPTCLADIAGGGPDGLSPDGIIDGSDFIAFINSFSIGDSSTDPVADVAGGKSNGLEPDGIIDGSDFIALINAIAAAC